MSTTFVTQPSLENHIRPMWEVEREPAADGSRVVRVGEQRFAVSQVAAVNARIDQTRLVHGRVVAMLFFGLAAALILVGVLQFSVNQRFLFAAFICGALALMSLQDVVIARPQRVARFDIRLKDGRVVVWSTASEADAAALNALLQGHA